MAHRRGSRSSTVLAAGVALILLAAACDRASTLEVSNVDLDLGEVIEFGMHAEGEITVDLKADGPMEACPAAAYDVRRGWAASWNGCIELASTTALPPVEGHHVGIAFAPIEGAIRIDYIRVHYTAGDGYMEVCASLPCE